MNENSTQSYGTYVFIYLIFHINRTNKLLTIICLFIVQLLWLCDLY